MASKSHLPYFLLLTQPGSGANRATSDPIIALACADYALNCHSIGRCQINLSDIHVLVSHLGGHRDNIDTVRSGSLAVTPSAARAIELGGNVGAGLLLQRIALGSLRLHLGRGGGVSHRITTI